jgi:hypothetical protein
VIRRLPRWPFVAVAIGLLLGYLTFGRDDAAAPEPNAPLVRTVAEGLRDTSVYEAPGAPGKVDAGFARRLIGDRPIVVAVLDEKPLPHAKMSLERQELCGDIADALATNIVIVFATDSRDRYDSSFCVGPEFANATHPADASHYDFPLIAVAEQAWQYRVSDDDLTPKIEEFVYAFDAQAAEDYPDGAPTRAVIKPPPPAPDTLQTWQIVLSVAGMVAGAVAVFLLFGLAARRVRRRGAKAAGTRTRREEASAELQRLADAVLHPGAPADAEAARRQAELARRYVLALGEFERARTKAALTGLERELRELAAEVAG